MAALPYKMEKWNSAWFKSQTKINTNLQLHSLKEIGVGNEVFQEENHIELQFYFMLISDPFLVRLRKFKPQLN